MINTGLTMQHMLRLCISVGGAILLVGLVEAQENVATPLSTDFMQIHLLQNQSVQKELKLTDDQRSRETAFFGQESDLPLTVGLVLDMSNSQRTFFKQHREDMKKFLKNVLQPVGRAF